MKKSKGLVIAIAAGAVVIIGVVVLIIALLAGRKDSYRVVKVESYDGQVTVDRKKEKESMDVFPGMNLITDDTVAVGDSSGLELLMDTDKHMFAEANTTFTLEANGTADAGRIFITIVDGSSLFEIDNKLNADSTFEVSTPNAVFSVRGTQFQVAYDMEVNETKLQVIEGVVAVDYEDGTESEEIEAGQGRLINETGSYNLADVADSGADGDASADGTDWGDVVAVTDGDVVGAYNRIVSDMPNYLVSHTVQGHDYITFDYMYFDYDGDGRKEVILYPGFYGDNDVYYRDVVFLDYREDSQDIITLAVSYNEANDSSFYAEYNGQLARYSWTTSPMESYLYVVVVGENLTYVLEQAYDEILVDLEGAGLHPVPLYGNWEMIFEG